MNKFKSYWAFLGAFIILGFAPGLYFYGNLSGFCFSDFQFVSDSKKIDLAIQKILISSPPNLKRKTYKNGEFVGSEFWVPKNVIQYKNTSSFQAKNPNCCKVVKEARKGWQVHWYNRIFGYHTLFVRVNYLLRYKSEDGSIKEETIQSFIPVSNCETPKQL